MPDIETDGESSPLKPGDILFILFRHKWKLILSSLGGIAAAIAFFFLATPVYESEAKLLLRYVVERSAVDSVDSQVKNAGTYNESLIKSEIEILTSWDIAMQVAKAVTVEKILPKAKLPVTVADAAHSIQENLTITSSKGSNVILVLYKNQDPELAVRVLDELVNRYFEKHLEVHRSIGAFEFVTQQTDQVRMRLKQTEDQLKQIKSKAGIVSVKGSESVLQAALDKAEAELHTAETERAEQQARVNEIERSTGTKSSIEAEAGSQPASEANIQQYRGILAQLAKLRESRLDLLSKYTPASSLVQRNQSQIAELERQQRQMEKVSPALIAAAPSAAVGGTASQVDLVSERARLAASEAKIGSLRTRLQEVRDQIKEFSDTGPQIAQLERKKELEEGNYKYFEASLEKARVDEALDPSKMPNISIVQKPSSALRATKQLKKVLGALAVGGIAFGVGLVLLIEFVLDQTVKRASELEKLVRIPLILDIPNVTARTARSLASPKSAALAVQNGKYDPWDFGHFIRPFCEALRDRLILHFQLKNMTHKPKLVALTSCGIGSGATTLAGGLAAELSNIGDGKVLLVDMNAEHAEVHPFFQGAPARSLTETLQNGATFTSANNNLYLATGSPAGEEPTPLIPKKLYDMMPRLKASDFDFIIFDLPPLGQTTSTLAMAGFMDIVLLVVEAEACGRQAVQRACSELAAAKANVATIFNKSRKYLPQWLPVDA